MMLRAWAMVACGVVGEAGIDFGGDAAGNDGENLLAEGDGQALEGEVGHRLIGWRCSPSSLRASTSTPSTMGWYCGICAAAVISEGLVVASWGRNFSIASMSPVSATTTVYWRNWSSMFLADSAA